MIPQGAKDLQAGGHGVFETVLDRRIGKKGFRIIDLTFILAVSVLGAYMRKLFLPIQSGDTINCLVPWMETIRGYGGLPALKYDFANYNIPYLFILCLLSYLPLDLLTIIKLPSVIFDFLTAILVMNMVYEGTGAKNKAILSYAVTLFVPTVFINGAIWGQCDIIYTFFLLLCIRHLAGKRSLAAMISFSLAFCFKMQAVFLLPVIALLVVKSYIKVRYLLAVPITYFVTILPGLIAGRTLSDIVYIYFGQTVEYPYALTMNFPNFYTFTGNYEPTILSATGICLTIAIVGCVLYYFYDKLKAVNLELIVTFSLLITGIMVYFLPHMHERYGFFMDLLVIIYVALRPKRIWVAMLMILVSLVAYGRFLFNNDTVPHFYLAIALAVCIGYTGLDAANQMNSALEGLKASENHP